MLHDLPEYEISYEYDGGYLGGILAFNLKGHGYSPEDVDWFLLSMSEDHYEEFEYGGDWEVRETWLRKVPHRDGGMNHVYGGPGRGASMVTVIERTQGSRYWCYKHPFEKAQAGVPTSTIIGGEELVVKRLQEMELEEDPRRNVEGKGSYGQTCGYIWYCRDCHQDYEVRLKAARDEALAKQKT